MYAMRAGTGNRGGVTPLVVLLHGFPDNAGTFFHQFGPISEQGRSDMNLITSNLE